ncbi:MAG: type II secretion system F family protein [bacterium]|nr:type II secretion system F family protein [bacterium]
MNFNYQARTSKGDVHTGQIEASSKEAAATLLQRRGLYVTFLEAATLPIYARRITLFEKIGRKDLALFSRQLSIMFKSKVPLIEALEVLSSQTKNISFKEKIFKISEKVEGGISFSQSLAIYPKIFTPFYIAMVKSGEVSGKLSEVLNYLADHQEREYNLTSRAKGALIYPSLIVLVIILVIVLMVVFVIPNLVGVLEAGGQELPAATKAIIALSDFTRSWGWLVLIMAIALIVLTIRYYATKEGKALFDKISLRLPIFGSFLKKIYISRFAENLSTLIAGGLPIVQSLEVVGDIIGNIPYKEAILTARDEVRKGEMISSTLSQFPDLFTPVFLQMVLVGEKTGTIDTTLVNIVDFYQKEVDRSIDAIIGILEPALIVFLGVVVGGIMMAVLMPIYQSMSL